MPKQSCFNPDYLKGEWRVVFDGKEWVAARVAECYWLDGVQLIDVVFIGTKKISRGHALYDATSTTPYWEERIAKL